MPGATSYQQNDEGIAGRFSHRPAAIRRARRTADGRYGQRCRRSAALKPLIIKAISTVYDPEIPVNIYELGLIYDIIVDATSAVGIRMTLTAPACPAAQFLPEQVRTTVAGGPGSVRREGRRRVGAAVGPRPHVGGRQSCSSDVVPLQVTSQQVTITSHAQLANPMPCAL